MREETFGPVVACAVVDGDEEAVQARIAVSAADSAAPSGTVTVSSGGVASSTTILNGGKATISAGGSAVGATISSGGADVVLALGTTTATVVSSGGQEIISGGVTIVHFPVK